MLALPVGFDHAYRRALRGSVDRAAVPYGYTALNVMTGATPIRTHGLPGTGATLLFLCGAVGGWGAAAPRADGPATAVRARQGRAVSGPSRPSVSPRTACAIAFGLVALAATAAYFGVGSLGPR